MSKFFMTSGEQVAAVERLLRTIGRSTKRYSVAFMESIESSDHQINAAMRMGYVDIWMTDVSVWLRVSEAGKEWLAMR